MPRRRKKKNHRELMLYFIPLLLCLSAFCSQPPQRIIVESTFLEEVTQIVYKECIYAGMTRSAAATAAIHWRNSKYPVKLCPIREIDKAKPESKKS
jgi:hypothetical protein